MYRRAYIIIRFIALFLFSCRLLTAQNTNSEFPFPIDIVYLWVDGNDPNWLTMKKTHLQKQRKLALIDTDACGDNRFADHEELKYSLRSLLQCAPFFHHIYIVTMAQRPKWLIDHPLVTIVDHKDLFLNPDDLPSFNSQAIESNLHRIPGLSEHFIYFNDDVFLGSEISPSDFFTPDGRIRVLFEYGYTVSSNPIVQASLYRQAWVNSNALLDAYFVPEPRHRLCHAPFALRKSLIEKTEELFPFVFSSNASHPFRSSSDFNLTNGLLQYIWLYQDLVVQGTLSNKMVSIYNGELFQTTKEALELLQATPLDTFCLQDCTTGEDERIESLLQNFFKTAWPSPAPWEQPH